MSTQQILLAYGASAPALGAIGNKITSYWDMSESGTSNRNDSKGTNHLVANGAVSTRTGVRGGGDIAADFDGTCFLEVASNSTLQVPSGGGNHELFGWVNLASTSGTPAIAAKWDASNALALEYLIDVEAGVLYITEGSSGYYYNATGPSPGTGTWRFVTMWRDATDGKVRLQMDDGTIGVSASASNPVPATLPVTFAATAGGNLKMSGGLQMWGWIKDDILTGAQRTTLINSGSGKTWAEIVSGGL